MSQPVITRMTPRGFCSNVLDTIEIQDVRVLSQEVFLRLQAPYRENLALEALKAREKVMREEERQREERLAHEQMLAQRAHQAELARLRERTEAERERQAIELAGKREAGELDAELERLKRSAHVDLTEAQLTEIMLTQTLPTMAQAFRGSFERVNIVQTSGEGGALFGFLTASIDHVLDTASSRGVRIPGRRQP
jgi:regulator of protease activity HflC (stomatin/prohibitin superfamily)